MILGLIGLPRWDKAGSAWRKYLLASGALRILGSECCCCSRSSWPGAQRARLRSGCGTWGRLETQRRQAPARTRHHQPREGSAPEKDLLFFQLPLASSFWAPTLRPATGLQCGGERAQTLMHSFQGAHQPLVNKSTQYNVIRRELPGGETSAFVRWRALCFCFEINLCHYWLVSNARR